MAYKRVEIPAGELSRQREICFEIRERVEASGRRALALVDTYEADSEELRGYIELMGYGFTENEAEADLIVVNTCAVREHAEMRVLGNVGALVHAKAKNPNLLVAVCGCMVQQPRMAEKLKKSSIKRRERAVSASSPPSRARASWPRACPSAARGRPRPG